MHASRLALVAAGAVTVLALATGARTGAEPRCFGAASRDPENQPCKNPALRYSVTPSPKDALLTPSSRCTLLGRSKTPEVCWFGVPAAQAVATVVLLGDSHAVHWRAALAVVARAKRWHALSLNRSQCSFSLAVPTLPEP